MNETIPIATETATPLSATEDEHMVAELPTRDAPAMAVADPALSASEDSATLGPGGAAAPGKIGVLVVNLGTPDTADASGVRDYLREFLSDHRVIEKQGPLWQAVLHGIILRTRPRRKAHAYRQIWNVERNE